MDTSKRLSEEAWDQIRARYEAGHRLGDVAEEYGIAQTTISRKAKTKGWKPHGSLREEAYEEARGTIKEKITVDFEGHAKMAFEAQDELYRYGQAASKSILEIIMRNIETLDEKARKMEEEDAGLEGREPGPYFVNLGNSVYQAKQAFEMMDKAMTGQFQLLKLDTRDLEDSHPPDVLSRLLQIFEAGQKHAKREGKETTH